ncbi:MAG: phosphoribosyl 1,2-cyclic phosphate phosphodiesterase [Pyrinomonadaceae bacterium]|jgi:phosphoribosyl 1,2-cyclic phosphate phosphodiesterase|nr:phosphoribosyl 1,2-cyclic phosphate phosphodiesterase [Pyrinomonadaceae bacterium]
MKLTFLGTGTSTGVPSIGCECETCTSADPRDKRLRVSVVIEHAGQSVLIDTSSDFRQQALRYGLKQLDAVLITHCHADHIFGLDDIRPLNFRYGALGVYANDRAWVDIRRIFKYIFEPSHFGGGLPQVISHTVLPGAQFCLGGDLLITPLEVIHGRLPVMAYRLNDFAYATDLSEIPTATLAQLQDLDALVLDCLRFTEHPTHLWLDKALAYIAEIKPKRAYLTHIAHDVRHARDMARLPAGVEWAYDGLEVSDE